MIDLLPPTGLGQPPQYIDLFATFGRHMGCQHHLAGLELPDVEVVDVSDPLAPSEVVLDFVGFDVLWGGLQNDIETELGDGPRGVYHEEGEDVRGDGV